MKIAVLSDIHANIYALLAVYSVLNDEGVTKILICGDIIGYYYWPTEVVEILMNDKRVICIKGNHEEILASVSNSLEAASYYRMKYGSGYDICNKNLSVRQRDWLFSLPKTITYKINGLKFHMSHGGASSINEYIYPDATATSLSECYTDADFTLLGHTHYPFVHTLEGRYLLNPGSVGQPRDTGNIASFALVNIENRVVQFKRVLFDIKPVIEMAKKTDPHLPYLANIMLRGSSN